MAKCVNLNEEKKSFVNSYSGFGFWGHRDDGNYVLEMGKYSIGKLSQGIKYYALLDTLEMGNFRNDNQLASGLKRFENGDVCVSKNFLYSNDSTKVYGKSVYIYKDGSWLYSDFKGEYPDGPAIYYSANRDKVFYREYHNERVVKELQLDLSGYNIDLRANIVTDEGLYYDLDKAVFNTTKYKGAESYSMGYLSTYSTWQEHGLGFIDWNGEEQFIGEWVDKNRTGLGSYFYDNQVIYGVYNKNKKTENSMNIFNTGEVSYGVEDSPIPRFTLFPSGDFYVRKSGDYVLYVKSNFDVTIEKYNKRQWVSTIKSIVKNGYLVNNSYTNYSNTSNTTNTTKTTNNTTNNETKKNNTTKTSTTKKTTTKKTNTTKTTLNIEKEQKSAEEELQALIGLTGVKKELKRIKAYLAKNKGKKLNLHMVFTGSPGTGKTVVARLMGKILYDNGVLPNDVFIEASRKSLVAEYIGQTAVKTNKIIDDAMGGVLFIDEAYSLNSHSEKDFGYEAVAELLKRMEDNRGDFCCIMAGYTKEMQDFISINPGFKSRIPFFIEFPNYTEEELQQIAKIFIKKNDLKADDKVVEKIIDIVNLKRNDKDFSNAREVRTIIDKIEMIQSERTIDDMEDRTLLMKDVDTYITENKIKLLDKNLNYPQIPMIDYYKLKALTEYARPENYTYNKSNIIESIVSITDNAGESSGFVFSQDGYILTTAHSISNEKAILKIRRRIFDRYQNEADVYYNGYIVAIDKINDIAILKIEAKGNIPYLTLLNENAKNFEPTREIVIMGYPFGVSRFDNLSITEGKIASYQIVDSKKKVINLDCEAKRGNSGSCVIDVDTGFVIGVLVGSHILGGEFQEEINYCCPTEYIWNLIKNNQITK